MGPHHPLDEALLSRLPARGSVDGNDEEKQPLDAKVRLEATGAVPEVLEALANVEVRDRRAERVKPILNGAGVVAGVGTIIAISNKAPLPVWLGVAVVALACFIAGSVFSRADVSDRKLEAMCTLLSTFASELRRGRPVRLEANLSGLTKMPAERDGDRRTYTCDWMHLDLPLADGTRAVVVARSALKRKSRQKRKYTKHKDQLTEQLTVQLIPPKGKSHPAQGSPPRPLVRGLTLMRAELKPRRATFVYRSYAPLRRLKGRYGWSIVMPGDLLDGDKLVAALIQSYRATATANRAHS
ncbi:MAG: hypothetical protein AAF715_09970 [Myxococcota bacterium]